MMTSAMLWVTGLLLGVASGASLGVEDAPCRKVTGTKWVAAVGDCSRFYLCVNGKAHKNTCGANIWDQNTKTCVEKGSRFDSCTNKAPDSDLEGTLEGLGEPCAKGEEFSAKKDNCAQYYDCSATQGVFEWEDRRLRECKYPFLWSTATQRCEFYTDVQCQDRHEPVDPCEYKKNQCLYSHCIPCNVRFATCRGKPDGLNAWEGKESSPFFAVCSNNHVVFSGQCEQSGGVQLFDGNKRTCVEVTYDMFK